MRVKPTVAFGGSGGSEFRDDVTGLVRMRGFLVRFGGYVDGITGVYQDYRGKTVYLPHGGSGGEYDIAVFDDDEYIVAVEGRADKFVDRITFHTNKRTYGPYGGTGGKPWLLKGNKLTGFWGRSVELMDQIGFYEFLQDTVWAPSQEYGGTGGAPFTSNLSEVHYLEEVTIWSSDVIRALQFKFQTTRGGVYTDVYGRKSGDERRISLGPDTYIAKVSGRADSLVRSLAFTLSTGMEYEFGGPGGTPFQVEGRIDGFRGRTGSHIDRIGFLVRLPATEILPAEPLTTARVEAEVQTLLAQIAAGSQPED